MRVTSQRSCSAETSEDGWPSIGCMSSIETTVVVASMAASPSDATP